MQKKSHDSDKPKDTKTPGDKTREEEAAEIMTMLVENKVFSQDEIAEIIFSDRTVICIPGKDKTPS